MIIRLCDWCKAECEVFCVLTIHPIAEAGNVISYDLCWECEGIIRKNISQLRDETKPKPKGVAVERKGIMGGCAYD